MSKRDYTADKKPLTIDEQISLLTERGLQGEESQIRQALTLMTYYHFSGFCFHFLQKDEAGNILDKFIYPEDNEYQQRGAIVDIKGYLSAYYKNLGYRHVIFVIQKFAGVYLFEILVDGRAFYYFFYAR